jgi:hypothetical protein
VTEAIIQPETTLGQVHDRETSSVQRSLQQLVHSWEILRTVFPDEATIKNWLHHPIRRLRGQTPLWLLQQEDGINSFEGLAEEFVEPTND